MAAPLQAPCSPRKARTWMKPIVLRIYYVHVHCCLEPCDVRCLVARHKPNALQGDFQGISTREQPTNVISLVSSPPIVRQFIILAVRPRYMPSIQHLGPPSPALSCRSEARQQQQRTRTKQRSPEQRQPNHGHQPRKHQQPIANGQAERHRSCTFARTVAFGREPTLMRPKSRSFRPENGHKPRLGSKSAVPQSRWRSASSRSAHCRKRRCGYVPCNRAIDTASAGADTFRVTGRLTPQAQVRIRSV